MAGVLNGPGEGMWSVFAAKVTEVERLRSVEVSLLRRLADTQLEVEQLKDWNHRVSVCRAHTGQIVDGACVVCEVEQLRTARDEEQILRVKKEMEVERLRDLLRGIAENSGPFMEERISAALGEGEK